MFTKLFNAASVSLHLRSLPSATVFASILATMLFGNIAAAQDFAKTLIEKAVTIDGRSATVTARHVYQLSTTIDSFGWKESLPVWFVALDVVWDNGERAQVFRMLAATPFEIPVEYRTTASQPMIDFDVWPRDAGDKLLVVWGRVVYALDPHAAMKPFPDPLVFRGGEVRPCEEEVRPVGADVAQRLL